MAFADKLHELRDCCDRSVYTLSLLGDEPGVSERLAERRMFAVELTELARSHSGPRRWRLGSAVLRVWHAAGHAITGVLRGAIERVEEMEQTLLRRYELACEAGPPMSVGSVLLRQHDALKRAEFHRRGR